MPSIILLSGPIASGKSTLAEALIQQQGFRRVKSSDYLRALCENGDIEVSRLALQEAGDDLDLRTDYQWLVTDVAGPQMANAPEQTRWLVDAVRKDRQVEHFRKAFGSKVLHVHISAPDELLEQRFNERIRSEGRREGTTSYAEAASHPNEVSARALKDSADLSMDLSEISLPDAVAAILEAMTRRE